MKTIKPTAFWEVFGFFKTWRFFVSVIIILLCMEIIARFSPLIIDKNVHQPFLYVKQPCQVEYSSNFGREVTWLANERGARGELYHGQPFQIALFGASTTLDTMLDQPDTCAEQLKLKLGSEAVHLDNYAVDGTDLLEAATIMEYLNSVDRHYDVVIGMFFLRGGDFSSVQDFMYSDNWKPTSFPIKFPSQLRRAVKRQIKNEPFLLSLSRAIRDSLKSGTNPDDVRFWTKAQKKKLRLSGRVEFAYKPCDFDAEQIDYFEKIVANYIKKAREVSGNIVVVLHPIAYDADELPGVAQKWCILRKVYPDSDFYLDNRSIAERVRFKNDIIRRIAHQHGVYIIDLDAKMRRMLRQRDDLFEDHWHFSKQGAKIASDIVAEELTSVLAETINLLDTP